MPELRRDPVNGRWVIVDTERPTQPSEFEVEKHIKKRGTCPFCYGNEQMTPPEVDVERPKQGKPDTSGWLVRVVPNKFPALKIDERLLRKGEGLYDMSSGVGAHEVIIETPDHNKEMCELSLEEMERVIQAYRRRSIELGKDERFKYILIFKNYGKSAGTSLEHPHSQLIALPSIPKSVAEELRGSHFYYEYKERCIFCDMLYQEFQDSVRMILDNSKFLSFAPFSSRFPYETWIVPKKHHSQFSSLDEEEIKKLAKILKEVLLRIKKVLNDPSYNFIIHTSPIGEERMDYHWHLEIMPRLIRTAGFEWGSGFYINPTSPEVAAEHLREVKI